MNKQVTKGPVGRARGYVNASMVSLGIAGRILPKDHPQQKKLAKVMVDLEKLHGNLVEDE